MLGKLQPSFSGWASLDRFRRDIDEVFERFFGEVGYRSLASSLTTRPGVESFLKDGNWVMRFDLPGVAPKDIDVSVAGDTLTVRASREQRSDERDQDFEAHEVSYGRFERSLTLPKGVDSDQLKASYQHGVLELTMPAPPQLAGRKIPIEIGMEEKKRLGHQAA
jgi:HSP20 family protein